MLRLTGAIKAKASSGCMVYIHKGAKCNGGIQLVAKQITNATDWLEYYDVKPTRGMAILYKAVDSDYSTSHARAKNIFYKPGETPEAPDWDPKPECGRGLHFSPSPMAALQFNSDATKFVACPVKVSEIVIHENPEYPSKVKAPRVYKPCYEVDRYGNPIKKG